MIFFFDFVSFFVVFPLFPTERAALEGRQAAAGSEFLKKFLTIEMIA